MTPPLLDELDALIARTRRRIALRRLVQGGAIGLHLGAWLTAFAVLALTQLVKPHLLLAAAGLTSLVLIGTLTLLTLAGSMLGRGLRKREVAQLIDRAFEQDERYVTAAWLADNPEHPNRDALLSHLARQPSQPKVLADALRIRVPRHLRFLPLAMLLTVLALFVPPLIDPLWGATSQTQTEGERLEERLQQLEEELGGAELPEELVDQVAELADELTGDDLDSDQAIDRIEELQKQLEAFEEQLEPSNSMLDDLEEAAEKLGEQLPDLQDALRDADLDRAADALDDLAQQSQQMSPEQKQAAGDAMRQAGEQLKQSQDPQMQQAGETLESTGRQLSQQGQQQQQQQGTGQQGKQGQQQGQQGQQGGQGLSQDQVQRLQEQLRQAQQAGEQLQQDRRALERAQRINGALEGSRQRLGGEAREQQGEVKEGQGERLEGQGEQGKDQGDPQGKGQGQGQGEPQPGSGSNAGQGHTWEDQGESESKQQFSDDDRNDSSRKDASDKHIDDFQRLYDAERLENVDALLAGAEGQIDEQGHIDTLPTRRTGSDETSGVKLIDAPESYTRAAQDAIANEKVPPGYRDAVKQYFDQME